MALDFVPAQPSPPQRRRSFTDFQVANPTAPPPGNWLDSASDEVNDILGRVIAWASRSLNSDGSLRPGVVGQAQLGPGLFAGVAQRAVGDIAPVAAEAKAAMQTARLSEAAAARHAGAASAQAATVAGVAQAARNAEHEAGISAARAVEAAQLAVQAAQAVDNSDNDALLAANTAQDYAVLAQAWAEWMPDTIPPNILAVMDISGSHWSSRWWALQATQIINEAENNLQALFDQLHAQLIDDLSQYYLGAHLGPPTGTTFYEGAMYWDTDQDMMYVWDGLQWVRIVTPVAGSGQDYAFAAATGQTVFAGMDVMGHRFKYDPAQDAITVFKNGLRLVAGLDYQPTLDTVTLATPCSTGDSVSMNVVGAATAANAQAAVPIRTSGWAFNGVNTTFALLGMAGEPLDPYTSADLFLSLDGVWLQPDVDYITASKAVQFAVAPAADVNVFGVCGIPVGSPPSVTSPLAEAAE